MASSDDIGLAAVARLAGVSTATVSNTLNRPSVVSAKTQERVRAAIDELHFVPNRAAATLRQGWNRLIGLAIPDVTNPFYAAIVDAVVEAADRERYAVALCVSHGDAEREQRHFHLLAEQRAAGAIVVPIEMDESRLTQLRMIGSHLILVDRIVPTDVGCSVAVDDVHGGFLAAQHLLASDGVGLTLVNGRRSIPQCAARREGVLLATAAAAAVLTEVEVPEMTIAEGMRAAATILERALPRRIFCTNDQLAVGVIRGLRVAGLSVPEDASVVGYGDLALHDEESRLLTTVGQQKADLGAVAVTKLLDELRDGEEHQHSTMVFTPELVVRASTSGPARIRSKP